MEKVDPSTAISLLLEGLSYFCFPLNHMIYHPLECTRTVIIPEAPHTAATGICNQGECKLSVLRVMLFSSCRMHFQLHSTEQSSIVLQNEITIYRFKSILFLIRKKKKKNSGQHDLCASSFSYDCLEEKKNPEFSNVLVLNRGKLDSLLRAVWHVLFICKLFPKCHQSFLRAAACQNRNFSRLAVFT